MNATIGRFDRVDALSELDYDFSPYNFVGNNPLVYINLFGMKRRKVDDERKILMKKPKRLLRSM